MPKERAPISTRLRNRDKTGISTQKTHDPAKDIVKKPDHHQKAEKKAHQFGENGTVFSPRVDTDIYLDELQSPLSFVRGTDAERVQYLQHEDELMSQSFGNDYKSSLSTSTFYYANVSAPIPSKRTKHQHPSATATKKRKSISKLQIPSMLKKKHVSASPSPFSLSPSPSPSPSPSHSLSPSPSLSSTSEIKKSTTKARTKTFSQQDCIHSSSPESNNSASEQTVPLPQSKMLPVYAKSDLKGKEKEFWRRQRRVFVYSRFITNEEGAQVAKTVYSNLSILPTNRMVISMQGNIANFRTKLRRVFIDQTDKFGLTKKYIEDTNDDQKCREIVSKMDDDTLKQIWDHWIIEPFVDADTFYTDKKVVVTLKEITAKLMILHFKELYDFLTPKQARIEMKKLDSITRTFYLPDNHKYP